VIDAGKNVENSRPISSLISGDLWPQKQQLVHFPRAPVDIVFAVTIASQFMSKSLLYLTFDNSKAIETKFGDNPNHSL
jgi:hypothetical protein